MRILMLIGAMTAAGVWTASQSRINKEASSEPAVGESSVVDEDSSRQSDFDRLMAALKRSKESSKGLKEYTAKLEHQVQLDGDLHDAEMMKLKFRRKPFSVYLLWSKDGQEALYVEGEHDDRLLVRPTHGLAALRGTWRLRPDSAQAMRDCRYPVTELGVEKLTDRVMDFYNERDNPNKGVHCEAHGVMFEDAPHMQFDVKFSPEVSPEIAQSELIFNEKTGVLVSVVNWSWNGHQKPGQVLEKYVYHNLNSGNDLPADAFEESNPDYQFASR